MKYNDIVVDIATRNGYSIDAVFDIAKEISNSVANGIKSGERIAIPGLGIFYAKERAPRIGRNMNRGAAPVMIPRRHVPAFDPCPELKQKVAEAFRGEDT